MTKKEVEKLKKDLLSAQKTFQKEVVRIQKQQAALLKSVISRLDKEESQKVKKNLKNI